MKFKIVFMLLAGCLVFAFSINGESQIPNKQKVNINAAESIRKILPSGWTLTEEGDTYLPLLWQGSKSCEAFQLDNPTVTHHHPIGGFDYHPAHTFWLCPPDFVGSQFLIGMVEQRYPANYLADGDAGILLHYSMGDNDWGSAPDDVVKALDLEKPKQNKRFCEDVIKVLGKVNIPEGTEIKCEGGTRNSILLSITTRKDLSAVGMNRLTDSIARPIIKEFPDKKRLIARRGYATGFDAVIVGFKADLH